MMVDPPHPFAKRGIDGILIEIAGPLPRAKQGTIEALHSRLTTTFARVPPRPTARSKGQPDDY
jgi:hypothetical protein